MGDFNNDGILDLIVAGGSNSIDMVALGRGDGTFDAWITEPGPPGPGSVVVGDFDNDGTLDEATLDGTSSDVQTALGGGNGLFCCARVFPTANATTEVASSIALGDMNGDGFLDVVGTDPSLGKGKGNGVFVLLGNGDGTFNFPQRFFIPGTGTGSIVISDFNRDGKLDVAVTNNSGYTAGTDNMAVLLGNGDGTFQPALVSKPISKPGTLAVGDFNGDGIPDLAVGSSLSNELAVLLGNGDGTFSNPHGLINNHGRGFAWMAAGDFNLDGKLDLAILGGDCLSCGRISILLGNGDGTFQAPVGIDSGFGSVQLVVADFNGDGKPDIAVLNNAGGNVSIFINTTP